MYVGAHAHARLFLSPISQSEFFYFFHIAVRPCALTEFCCDVEAFSCDSFNLLLSRFSVEINYGRETKKLSPSMRGVTFLLYKTLKEHLTIILRFIVSF